MLVLLASGSGSGGTPGHHPQTRGSLNVHARAIMEDNPLGWQYCKAIASGSSRRLLDTAETSVCDVLKVLLRHRCGLHTGHDGTSLGGAIEVLWMGFRSSSIDPVSVDIGMPPFCLWIGEPSTSPFCACMCICLAFRLPAAAPNAACRRRS